MSGLMLHTVSTVTLHHTSARPSSWVRALSWRFSEVVGSASGLAMALDDESVRKVARIGRWSFILVVLNRDDANELGDWRESHV